MADAGIEKLFGDVKTLKGKDGDVPLSDLAGKYVAIYFSAHWCPPCRGFTPKLAELYTKVKEAGHPWEIIFLSSDRDQKSFDDYFAEMPWLALGFEHRDLKAQISSKFGVKGIPMLVLLNDKGELLNTNGRAAVTQEPDGFPWIPPTFEERVPEEVVNNKGEKLKYNDLKGKHLLFYHSAHWCPPCKAFTPKLAAVYKKLKEQRDDFEVIFVSSDRDEAQFNEYLAEMPWYAVPFANEKSRNRLDEHFGVQGIPQLTLATYDGKVENKNCRGKAEQDVEGKDFPWVFPTLPDFTDGVDGIDEKPSLILLQNEESEEAQKNTAGFLLTIAEEQKALEGDRKYNCFTANKEHPVVGKIRQLCKVEKGGKMILLDIPDNGGFYEADLPADLAAIRAMIEGYEAKTLARKQLA